MKIPRLFPIDLSEPVRDEDLIDLVVYGEVTFTQLRSATSEQRETYRRRLEARNDSLRAYWWCMATRELGLCKAQHQCRESATCGSRLATFSCVRQQDHRHRPCG